MNVYIVPTPAIPRGFDKRLASSWRQVPGVGSFSLASDSRLPGASQRRQHLRSVGSREPQPPSGSILRMVGGPRMAAQGIWVGMEAQQFCGTDFGVGF